MKKFVFLSMLFVSNSIYSQGGYSIEYDHNYYWKEVGINMAVTVAGKVPFHLGNKFAVITKCESGSKDSLDNLRDVANLEGEGEVTAKGKAILGDGSDPHYMVEMTFEVPVKVTLKGKTWWKDGTCAEMWNLSYEEFWTEDAIWQVKADDPEAAAMVKSFLPLKLGNQVNKLTEKSLEFQRWPYFADHPIELEEEAFMNMGVPMKGKIKYKINLPTSGISTGGDLQYDMNGIQPSRDYTFPDLHWGPPLDQIIWNTIDLDKLPK